MKRAIIAALLLLAGCDDTIYASDLRVLCDGYAYHGSGKVVFGHSELRVTQNDGMVAYLNRYRCIVVARKEGPAK